MSADQKHILVVDDDETFRDALSSTLKSEGFLVSQAAHANLAKDLIKSHDIQAVISDINMPETSGIELMHFSKSIKPELPFILMTGFAELKETKEAYELGARGFLPKPFKKEELLAILQEWMQPRHEEVVEESQDLNYCKLCIDDFISGHEIKHDIYVRLSEKKYLKIAHQGEDIPLQRINAYKSKGIQFLYMQKEEFRKYMGLNLKLLPIVQSKSTISKEKKRSFLKHTSEVLMEHLHLNGVDEEGFQNAAAIVESTVSILTEPDDMMNLLTMLNNHGDHLYAHALGVSTYGVMIARKVGWHAAANVHKVALGGLLHDIGKKEIPREILEKPRKDMTSVEIRIYESHPQRGRDILAAIPSVPNDVLQIVMQHHEDCAGTGFPMHMTRKNIHPMAKLIAVANEFCKMVLKGPQSLGLSPADAINRINAAHKEKYDIQFLGALMAIFKVQPQKTTKSGRA